MSRLHHSAVAVLSNMAFLRMGMLLAMALLAIHVGSCFSSRMLVEEPGVPHLPKLDIPELPKLHVPELHEPEIPKLHVPELHEPEIPNLHVPELHEPEIPKLHVPELHEPEIHIPELPKIHVPELPHESLQSEKDASHHIADQTLHQGPQVASACKVNFSKLDYSPVTSVCKGPSYDMHSCCAAFSDIACKYSEHVNDFSTTCPLEFISFLNSAGNYPHGVFINRCVSGNKLCN